jgi:spore coat protein U-like protein
MRRAVTTAVALALSLVSGAARATSTCRFVATTPFSFGTYDTFNPAPTDSVASMTVLCTGVTTMPPIVLQLGRGRSGSFFPRAMTGLAYSLSYNLFVDAARLTVWGDGSGGTTTLPVSPQESQPYTVQVYGRIFPMQNVAAGLYADSVLVTVQF